ncbi:immunity protein YezG family protein [Micromonospora costi]|nr:immunity protein YezG family protein [Micromonospora costi]
MFDESQHDVVSTIGGILLKLMPNDAVKIIAKGDLGEESAGVSIQWRTSTGAMKHFPFDEQPFEEIIQLSDAFISLRQLMVADGHDPWHGITFAIDRDGEFDVDLAYDQPE